jgi:DNA-binding ferritin-like protein (Dps family)
MLISKFFSKLIGEKAQWRQYRARAKQLPEGYRTALEALERYLMYCVNGGDGTAIYADLIDLFEQSAADRTPIRQVVGEDPVEFIETFVRNYPKGNWVLRERERLNSAIARVGEGEARAQGAGT